MLLANEKLICKSLDELKRRPLATYQYVIVEEGDERKITVSRIQLKKDCFEIADKIKKDFDMLKAVCEMLGKRKISENTKSDFLLNQLYEFIDDNPELTYKVLTTPSLKSFVFVKSCVSASLIIKSGDFYYLKSGKNKIPMSDDSKDPTLENAVKFLNNPKNQEVKFALEAQLKNPSAAKKEEAQDPIPEVPSKEAEE